MLHELHGGGVQQVQVLLATNVNVLVIELSLASPALHREPVRLVQQGVNTSQLMTLLVAFTRNH